MTVNNNYFEKRFDHQKLLLLKIPCDYLTAEFCGGAKIVAGICLYRSSLFQCMLKVAILKPFRSHVFTARSNYFTYLGVTLLLSWIRMTTRS